MPFLTLPIPFPWIIDGYSSQPQASNGALTANTVYLYAFEINTTITLTGMRWRMAATATGKTDSGIYDANGNLLASIGATVNTASADNTAAFSGGNLTIPPGRYYMAITPGNATDTYSRLQNLQLGTNPIIRSLTAANNSTGTTTPALPTTTGAVSDSTTYVANSALVLGGIS